MEVTHLCNISSKQRPLNNEIYFCNIFLRWKEKPNFRNNIFDSGCITAPSYFSNTRLTRLGKMRDTISFPAIDQHFRIIFYSLFLTWQNDTHGFLWQVIEYKTWDSNFKKWQTSVAAPSPNGIQSMASYHFRYFSRAFLITSYPDIWIPRTTPTFVTENMIVRTWKRRKAHLHNSVRQKSTNNPDTVGLAGKAGFLLSPVTLLLDKFQ